MLTRTRTTVTALALSGALGLAACGDDEKKTSDREAAEHSATPAQAVAEIGETRTALDAGLKALRSGDRAKAQELISEGYVQHFEGVEGPLGKVDHELNERLEEAISMEIRDKIKQGAPVSEIEALITSTKADLATAERKLK